MKSPLLSSLVLLWGVLLSAHSVSAELLVAENEVDPITFGTGIFNDQSIAQIFTATDSGTISTIRLEIWRDPDIVQSADLFIDVTTLDGTGRPDSVLGTQSLAPLEIDADQFVTGFTLVDFSSSNIELTANEMYALVLRSEVTGAAEDWYLWAFTDTESLCRSFKLSNQSSLDERLDGAV